MEPGKDNHYKEEIPQQVEAKTSMERLLGFSWRDVSSWHSFTLLLNRPMDPAGLGFMRFMFGFLMILDIPQERGLSNADVKWGDTMECRFPLFDALFVPPLEWVCLMYFIMLLGAVGIMVGLFYRLSCLLFLLPYWYLFLLDKSSWNNHSYLYGLMALLFLISDGNRYWSLDCWLKPSLKNVEIPLWNYTLFRIQIFLLYHIAGLKKFDQDWLGGYSMSKLSQHWVFVPFKFLMSESSIDFYVVHVGGFILDLTIGFFMFFDVTRIVAFFFCSMFNLMNSQMFHIGMFPFTMLATMTLFCHPAWPRTFTWKYFPCFKLPCPTALLKPSAHCLYLRSSKHTSLKASGSSVNQQQAVRPSFRHKAAVIFSGAYIIIQLFLPYSHFITKGYNTWTNGLYGYSWDMMVHSWQTLHTRIVVLDKVTGQKFYLDPKKWVGRDRWTAHADMAKQYASCMQRNLEMYGLKNVSIYMDIWKSLNRRFQQRIFRPDVDILTANWSPFAEVPWVMPLLSDLSEWRTKLTKIESQFSELSTFANVVFFADFPGLQIEIWTPFSNTALKMAAKTGGSISHDVAALPSPSVRNLMVLSQNHSTNLRLHLDTYISYDIENVTFEVLEGQVMLALPGKNLTLSSGEKAFIPSDTFHSVYTVSDFPSCFFYLYFNATEKKIFNYIRNEGAKISNLSLAQLQVISELHYKEMDMDRNISIIEKLATLWHRKIKLFHRSIVMLGKAIRSLVTQIMTSSPSTMIRLGLED